MRTLAALPILFLGLTLASAPARGDDLVQAAKKERLRREALAQKKGIKPKGIKPKEPAAKEAPEVLTNQNIKRSGGKGVLSEVTPNHATASAGAAAAKAGAKEKGKEGKEGEEAKGEEKPKQDDDYWRGRVAESQKAVEAARKNLADLNQRINEARRQASSVSDPNIRFQKDQEMRAAEADLARAQKAIADAEKAVAQMREEARHSGASPGALR